MNPFEKQYVSRALYYITPEILLNFDKEITFDNVENMEEASKELEKRIRARHPRAVIHSITTHEV